MPPRHRTVVGANLAAARRMRRMTQRQLADAAGVSAVMVSSIEQGVRVPSDAVLGALAGALDLDPARLVGTSRRTDSRVHQALPAVAAAAAGYDLPDDGPVRSLEQLRASTAELTGWRLAAQYTKLSEALPDRLEELTRAVHQLRGGERLEAARLLAAAYRAADACAYKYGWRELSAVLVDRMRWAAGLAEDPLWEATAAYVRTEVFFGNRDLGRGLRMLEGAIDRAPAPGDAASRAVVGSLHMRAAVVAGRARDEGAAREHLAEARELAERVREGSYFGTAFGPTSWRIHELSVAVELRDSGRALEAARQWKPPVSLPEERRSHYYVDVARAQFWAGLNGDAFESLQVARRLAPQAVREQTQVRDMLRSLLREQRAERAALVAYAEWAGVV